MISIRPSHMPIPLKKGEEVLTVAASSQVTDEHSLQEGLRVLESWGLICRNQSVSERKWKGFAGDDQSRFAELHHTKPARLKVFARGGWGAARLLERYQPWEQGWLVGFSDVSSILLSRLSAGFGGGIHGPLVTSLANEPDWSKDRLKAILFGESIPELYGDSWVNGVSKGPLVACNLTVASHLLGSRHTPDLDGAILVLEDIGEEPYRIDRMLTQWRLAGLLQKLGGIAFGKFINCESEEEKNTPHGFQLNEILLERSKDLKIPIIGNLPVGHCQGNAALPLGREALLDGRKGLLKIIA